MSTDTGFTATLDAPSSALQTQAAALLERFESLRPGQSFQLSTGDEPQLLRQSLQARLGVSLTWEILESGPAIWRVQIGKRGAASSSCCAGGACGG